MSEDERVVEEQQATDDEPDAASSGAGTPDRTQVDHDDVLEWGELVWASLVGLVYGGTIGMAVGLGVGILGVYGLGLPLKVVYPAVAGGGIALWALFTRVCLRGRYNI
ncbi:hypothetical protein BRD00_09870 [Halobacteriales archaeon QS_8_69_26]|nr:MAG: hypothetical protein BRD00_09870 [Halobacteriales archaeon QS_8_69_26]